MVYLSISKMPNTTTPKPLKSKRIKKETLEQAAHEYFKRGQLGFEKAADTEMAFLRGAKWQAERMYTEDEVYNILLKYTKTIAGERMTLDEFFKQHKK